MDKIKVPALEKTIQKTQVWLKDLAQSMEWEDLHLAYLALKAVLQALRDRLPIEVAAKLGAQLPMLIRGMYYEDWIPAQTPVKVHHREEFLLLVAGYLGDDRLISNTALITANAFKVIKSHLSEGETEHLKKVLPKAIASLWDF